MALESRTIDDEIREDWQAIREKFAVEPEEPAAPEPVAEPPASEPSGEDSEPAADSDAQPRDETGRFTTKPAEKPTKEAAAPVKTAAVPVAPEAPESEQPQRDITRPPSTWRPTARAEWDKLSPAIKAEIHRRETDFLHGREQLLPDARFGESIRKVVEPYRMLIEAEGGTPERAIADLMRTAALLRVGTPEQKTQLFLQTAQQFGVDLRTLAGQPAPSGQAPPGQTFQDPRVDQLIAHMNQERSQRVEAEQQHMETEVLGWMNENDAQGNPARPYLGDVINEMSALVPQIRNTNPSLSHSQVLQMAYERATWAHPEVRSLLQQQERQTLEQQRATENQNRVREARRAASVNVPRRASMPNPGKPGSLEETIASTARELGLIT